MRAKCIIPSPDHRQVKQIENEKTVPTHTISQTLYGLHVYNMEYAYNKHYYVDQ